LIRTEFGEAAVEDLAIGDRLVTAAGTVRKVRWIGRRAYDGKFVAGNRDVLPIRFKPGSLGDGVPRRDLYVSPPHAMYLDGMLIPAWVLVNGASIVQDETVARVEYFHLELDTHDVILAEGAASESFVDDGGRGMFQNAAEHRALNPDAAVKPAAYCAPRHDHGEAVERVQARLTEWARACGFAPALPAVPDVAMRVISNRVPAGSSALRVDAGVGRAEVIGVVLDGERLDPMELHWIGGDAAIEVIPDRNDRWCHIELIGDKRFAAAG